MTLTYQETDARTVIPFIGLRARMVAVPAADETLGGVSRVCGLPPIGRPRLLDRARRVVSAVADDQVRGLACAVLDAIQSALAEEVEAGAQVSHLPPVCASSSENGSVLVEWLFPDFRVGFSVEPDLRDSGWYLASNQRLGEIGASGLLLQGGLRGTVRWLVGFVVRNT